MSKPHKPKKSYEQLETELKLVKSRCLWEGLNKLQPLKWGVFAYLGYCAYMSVHELSGKITEASINVKAEASLNPLENPSAAVDDDAPVWPYWMAGLSAILATAGISYGFNQRRLRKLTVEHLAPYKEKWELTIDPKRTSSGLLPDGSTNPNDE
jgi:hypothetical protein